MKKLLTTITICGALLGAIQTTTQVVSANSYVSTNRSFSYPVQQVRYQRVDPNNTRYVENGSNYSVPVAGQTYYIKPNGMLSTTRPAARTLRLTASHQARTSHTIGDSFKAGTRLGNVTLDRTSNLVNLDNLIYQSDDVKYRESQKTLSTEPLSIRLAGRNSARNNQLEWGTAALSDAQVNDYNQGRMIDFAKVERHVIDLVNQERARLGRSPVQQNQTMSTVATIRAMELANYGSARVNGRAHVRPDGRDWNTIFTDKRIPKPQITAENLSMFVMTTNSSGRYTYNPFTIVSERAIAERIYQSMRNSPQHYGVMTGPVIKKLGVTVRLTKANSSATIENNTMTNNFIAVMTMSQ